METKIPVILTGSKRLATKGMCKVLNTQESSTFPTAISAFPLRTDEMLTANSGSVVPEIITLVK
jgi:hypothetical protein